MREQIASAQLPSAASPFAGFNVHESCGLYDVLASLCEQVIGFTNQPRFEDAALGFLEDMSEDLYRQMRELATHIKATTPRDRNETVVRAKTLIRDAMLDTDNISELTAVAAALAAPERH